MSDDAFRAQVLTMYASSDSNLQLMLERIVRSLQDCGRNDVRMQGDSTGAIFTIAQAARYIHGVPSFAERLERIAPSIQAEVDAARLRIESIAIPDLPVAGPAGAAARHRGDSPRHHGSAKYRCFPLTEKDLKRQAFPTSRYSGNYTLQRYGGAFPPYCNYGFYSRYGYDGRGAVSAEFHNFPSGSRPPQDHIYA